MSRRPRIQGIKLNRIRDLCMAASGKISLISRIAEKIWTHARLENGTGFTALGAVSLRV